MDTETTRPTLRDRIERYFDDLDTADRLLNAALHALRSYQRGNTAPALAEEVADEIERFLEPADVDELEAERDRALGEGAGLREAIVTFLDDTSDRHWPEQYERLKAALAASPLAKLVGEVVEAAERRVDAMRMGLGGDVPDRDLAEAVEALRAELAREGGEDGG